MEYASVRYIVTDVDAAVAFYTEHLGFRLDQHPAPGFAQVSLGALRVLFNRPGAGGAGQAMPDGRFPEPGGWNRIRIEFERRSAGPGAGRTSRQASLTLSELFDDGPHAARCSTGRGTCAFGAYQADVSVKHYGLGQVEERSEPGA
jgi:catechol 2,3-dioxygenase-like lactoylglutathione lyase family enzyme